MPSASRIAASVSASRSARRATRWSIVASRAGSASASASRPSLVRRPPPATSSVRRAMRSRRSSERIEPAERTGEQLRGDGRRQVDPAEARLDHLQQCACRRVVAEGGARRRAPHRHLGMGKGAPDRVHVGAAARDDDELAPRHAVPQMPLAQQPGDRAPLARGRRRPDLHGRRVGRRVTCASGLRWMPAVAAPIRPVIALVRARSGAGWRCDSVRTSVGSPGRPQHRAQAAQHIRLAAAERVRRDVRVAERDDRDAPARRARAGSRSCPRSRPADRRRRPAAVARPAPTGPPRRAPRRRTARARRNRSCDGRDGGDDRLVLLA